MTHPAGNLKHPPSSLMTLYVGSTTLSFTAVRESPTVLGVSVTLPPEIPEEGELQFVGYQDDYARQERRVWWVRSDA